MKIKTPVVGLKRINQIKEIKKINQIKEIKERYQKGNNIKTLF